MKTKLAFLLFFIISIAGLGGVGCKQEAQESSRGRSASPAPVPSTENTFTTPDAEITAAVKAKLMQDENVAARRIDVKTENGVVTLRGIVATDMEASRAMELAKTADGVRLVQSYLKKDSDEEAASETDQSSRLESRAQDAIHSPGEVVETGIEQAQDLGSDAAITAQIKWKLAKDKVVQAADIDVDTKDRRVILTGTVSSKQEATRALQIAQSIEEVVEVDSNIRVQ